MPQVEHTKADALGWVALATLVLVILKVERVVTWSWWVVFAPLWVPVGVVVLSAGLLLVVLLVMWVAAVAQGERSLWPF